jgi:cystathionine beta-lyase
MERHGARTVAAGEFSQWLGDANRTTYLLDVRTPEEFEAGSIAGAVHAPGGQLIQATDQWVGIRNARVVLIDSEGVRAPVVASWLTQLGHEAYVLEGGTGAAVQLKPVPRPALPQLARITPAELKEALDRDACSVIDVGRSLAFRKGHIPASRWSVRSLVARAARAAKEPLVLVAADDDEARLAAVDLAEAGVNDLKLLQGGVAAWKKAGYPTESSPAIPADGECIDHLWFVHDRHAGNREAMKQYLAWETGLMAQLQPDERCLFRI